MRKKKVKKRAIRFDWRKVWWGAAFLLFILIVLLSFWLVGELTTRQTLITRPVSVDQTSGIAIKLYYYNENSDAILPVERIIQETNGPLQAAVRLLIKGDLTSEEKAAGYTTEFPHAGFNLVRADLEKGVLTLEFTDVPGFTTGGATRVELLAEQIEKTARQFPGVKTVRFLPDSLFQP
ncbi:MAG: GerMN domain-containing protein [Candidatus Margulisbacteria bacterium]|nr:GerMN domain-containing protein [Candidatus Margulisiibacteriota bacterium]MBU1617321.1 GerMN domain-containing protein [Candidatus Margulisiibacteriota bacterium]MBU1867323.1 GerMN domain-containing protein [Candidatus Margulisiibacteriota bacterium]